MWDVVVSTDGFFPIVISVCVIIIIIFTTPGLLCTVTFSFLFLCTPFQSLRL